VAIAPLPDEWLLQAAPSKRPFLRLLSTQPDPVGPWAEPLRPVPILEVAPPADESVVRIKAGHRASTSVRVRRRRLALAVILVGIGIALALPVSALAGRPVSSGSDSGAGTPVATPLKPGTVYTVRAGDNLWSIATRLDPTGDPRIDVAQMAGETRSDTLMVGERIRLP